jgi:hypothetical protein
VRGSRTDGVRRLCGHYGHYHESTAGPTQSAAGVISSTSASSPPARQRDQIPRPCAAGWVPKQLSVGATGMTRTSIRQEEYVPCVLAPSGSSDSPARISTDADSCDSQCLAQVV